MSNQSYLSICHQNKDGAVKNDTETSMPSAPIPINAGGREGNGKKKTRRAMPWMRFSRNGNTEVIECDTRTIMKRVSIPARDLRIRGPLFSSSSNILGREKSIIVNLENIKAIVTANEVLLLDPLRPQVLSLIDQLKKQFPQRNVPEDIQSSQEAEEGIQSELPFEFQVLESAFEVVCSFFDTRVTSLETEALPVLAELIEKVTRENLRIVRSLKSNLTCLIASVQKVKDEIEHLLDDDKDMAEFYLTRKVIQSQQEDVEDLEMLLEAYLIQVEGTRNKLHTMRKYIDDTEDYVKIKQKDKRNRLLVFKLMISRASFAISAGTLVVSLFGMNIPIPLYNTNGVFGYLVLGVFVMCIVLFMFTFGKAGWEKLL
ncbi:PREDICTED: magnesium transporter MRS2-4-like [Brassica oleracea var. oleracea]|uniref:Magnesium transporter n=1 Tax=Brassica oleracea var. oleracea TaxID=109376 RepID=A0A0D3BZ36_BRAOL|nr:PREDICTED: magnesium transporter MRS2-4-like [Brassica oleracea var. oleracea]